MMLLMMNLLLIDCSLLFVLLKCKWLDGGPSNGGVEDSRSAGKGSHLSPVARLVR